MKNLSTFKTHKLFNKKIQNTRYFSTKSSSETFKLTHTDAEGKASMVAVGHKQITDRKAIAQGRVLLGKEAFDLVIRNQIKKGDVFGVAKIAGISAAKQTGYMIPLCHPLLLTHISVDITPDHPNHAIIVTATVECCGKTGVEVEAIMAVSVACCTVYDMCKAVNKGISIDSVRLLFKSGGKSGDYTYNSRDVDS